MFRLISMRLIRHEQLSRVNDELLSPVTDIMLIIWLKSMSPGKSTSVNRWRGLKACKPLPLNTPGQYGIYTGKFDCRVWRWLHIHGRRRYSQEITFAWRRGSSRGMSVCEYTGALRSGPVTATCHGRVRVTASRRSGLSLFSASPGVSRSRTSHQLLHLTDWRT